MVLAAFGVLIGIVLLILISVALVLHAQLTATEAYKEALRIAGSSPELQSSLGNDIHVKGIANGLTFNWSGSHFTEFSVGIEGSKGSGRISAVANTVNQDLEFFRLSFLPGTGGRKIDLTPTPTRLVLPKVPAQKVYLVPLGLDPSESLDWAPGYYKAKFGIEVAVLPAAAMKPEFIDQKRKQADSDKCVAYVRSLYPELDRDPSTLLFVVTSQDIFIPHDDWAYTVNYRDGMRFAVVSSARLHSFSLWDRGNPEWLSSRVQKMLTKNIAMLYFNLSMSDDSTSLMYGGRLSGLEIDAMGGKLIGVTGKWVSFGVNFPGATIYDIPNKPALWRSGELYQATLDSPGQVFEANLAIGGFAEQSTDLVLEGKYPVKLSRTYMSNDLEPRQFGVGVMDSLDLMLVGQMGNFAEIVGEYGRRTRFQHSEPRPGQVGDIYVASGCCEDFSGAVANYQNNLTVVTRPDGWKFRFPFLGHAIKTQVTVLTGYTDPQGHEYKMERDKFGDLQSVTTPDGQWMLLEHDAAHRVTRIAAYTGQTLIYEYDAGGRLCKVTNSDGNVDSYTYDEKSEMVTAAHGDGKAILRNTYGTTGYLIKQELADGSFFEYHYNRDLDRGREALFPDLMTDPNGLVTFLQRDRGYGYRSSLPKPQYQ
jgi:YD repeat-containing protein